MRVLRLLRHLRYCLPVVLACLLAPAAEAQVGGRITPLEHDEISSTLDRFSPEQLTPAQRKITRRLRRRAARMREAGITVSNARDRGARRTFSSPLTRVDDQGRVKVYLTGHPPDGSQPQPQGLTSVLEHRASGDRGLPTAARALPQPLPDRPSRAVSAARTAESFRPAQLEQIIPTSLLRRKAGLELSQVPRIVLHRTAYYILGLPESSKYPIYRDYSGLQQYALLMFQGRPPRLPG